MANCKICGQPVRSGNVFHPACWETSTARIASEICDDYCRYAREIGDQDLLDQQCERCPVPVFEKQIRWSKPMGRAVMAHEPVCRWSPTSGAARDYRAWVREYLGGVLDGEKA